MTFLKASGSHSIGRSDESNFSSRKSHLSAGHIQVGDQGQFVTKGYFVTFKSITAKVDGRQELLCHSGLLVVSQATAVNSRSRLLGPSVADF